MKLPAFFGHKNSINLLPRDKFESSTVGVVLTWALTFGKWSVILTQLVVMGAFLTRFGYDRKLTDLNKDIAQSIAVIESYKEVEQAFLVTQQSVQYAGETLELWDRYQAMMNNTNTATPRDVWYERLIYTPTNFSLSAYSASLTGFGRLLTDIQRDPRYSAVNIGSIEDGSTRGARLKFDISLSIKENNGNK